jgi:hypothetical protein
MQRAGAGAGAQLTALAAVDELASVHALGGGELDVVLLEAVTVLELDLGDWRATAGVVDDLLDHAAHVAVALSEVDRAQAARTLPVLRMRDEDGASSLTLPTDDATL